MRPDNRVRDARVAVSNPATAAMLIGLKACAKDVEEKIKRIHEDPAPLEAGKLTIGSVRGTAPGAM
jgi:hypothetical protein